jgi:hypothetical protein
MGSECNWHWIKSDDWLWFQKYWTFSFFYQSICWYLSITYHLSSICVPWEIEKISSVGEVRKAQEISIRMVDNTVEIQTGHVLNTIHVIASYVINAIDLYVEFV